MKSHLQVMNFEYSINCPGQIYVKPNRFCKCILCNSANLILHPTRPEEPSYDYVQYCTPRPPSTTPPSPHKPDQKNPRRPTTRKKITKTNWTLWELNPRPFTNSRLYCCTVRSEYHTPRPSAHCACGFRLRQNGR
jgi:hypothetical protein